MTQVQRARDAGVTRVAHDEAQDNSHWVATRNIRNQERLFRDIVIAQVFSGEQNHIVAGRLGISEDDLREAVSGKTDLTMTELRMLASACDVVVDYRVVPAWVDRRRHIGAAKTWLRSARAVWSHLDDDDQEDWDGSGLADFFVKRLNSAS
jgi:hypothetical protein